MTSLYRAAFAVPSFPQLLRRAGHARLSGRLGLPSHARSSTNASAPAAIPRRNDGSSPLQQHGASSSETASWAKVWTHPVNTHFTIYGRSKLNRSHNEQERSTCNETLCSYSYGSPYQAWAFDWCIANWCIPILAQSAMQGKAEASCCCSRRSRG